MAIQIRPKKTPVKSKAKTPEKAAVKAPKKEKAPLTPVQLWMEKMNKSAKYRGSAAIRMASDVKNPYGLRRPTGKLALDIALGGGLHAGGVIQVEGTQSVGKTHFCWECAAQQQHLHGEGANIFLAATELRPDKGQARLAGYCVAYSDHEIKEMDEARQAKGLAPFTDEDIADLKLQVGSLVIAMADNAEKLFDVVLDALDSNIFQLAIIDSMGALLPKAKEETDSFSEKSYGGASVPVTDFVNKIYPLLIRDRPDGSMMETTILAINQARARIGGTKFERSTKEAMGAYAWKHSQLVNILLERGAKVRETKEGPPIGYSVRWELLKGKAGTHDGKKGSYDYYHLPKMEPVFWRDVTSSWYGGVAYFNEHAETAAAMGVVEGTGWYTFKRKNGETVRAQGIDNFAQLLAEDVSLLNELRDACFVKAGIFVRYK